jgi:hypothetical protein
MRDDDRHLKRDHWLMDRDSRRSWTSRIAPSSARCVPRITPKMPAVRQCAPFINHVTPMSPCAWPNGVRMWPCKPNDAPIVAYDTPRMPRRAPCVGRLAHSPAGIAPVVTTPVPMVRLRVPIPCACPGASPGGELRRPRELNLGTPRGSSRLAFAGESPAKSSKRGIGGAAPLASKSAKQGAHEMLPFRLPVMGRCLTSSRLTARGGGGGGEKLRRGEGRI